MSQSCDTAGLSSADGSGGPRVQFLMTSCPGPGSGLSISGGLCGKFLSFFFFFKVEMECWLVWRLPVVAAWVSERVCFQSLGSFPRELSREIACLLSSTYEAASVYRAQRRPHREREDRKTQGFVVGQAQLCSPPGPG